MGLKRLDKNDPFYLEQEALARLIAELDLGYAPNEEYAIAFAQINQALFVIFFSGAKLSADQQQAVVDVVDAKCGAAQSRYIVHGDMMVDRGLIGYLNDNSKGKKFNIGCAEKKAITYSMIMKKPILTLSPFMLKHQNKRMDSSKRCAPCSSCERAIAWYLKA